MTGYHFTGEKLRDGRPVPAIGEWLEHDGKVVPCQSGLHMSEHPLDALKYAEGTMLHLVELDGGLTPHGDPIDKWAGRRRLITATIDANDLLQEFRLWCALQVVDLWDCPDITRKYLETGDDDIRGASMAACWDWKSSPGSKTGNGAAALSAWAAAELSIGLAQAAASAARYATWATYLAAKDVQAAKLLELVETAFSPTNGR